MKTTKQIKTLWLGAGIVGFTLAAAAGNIYKADVADNLNLDTSWVGGIAPGASDIAVWDHTVVNNLSSSPGAGLNWLGLQILDPAGAITINADGNTLTNGASGLDLSQATNGLTINCPVVLGAAQTWAVTNAQKLTVGGIVSGASALTLAGGGTVELTAANTYSGGTLINGAIVEPDNAACFGAAAANVTNNDDYLLFDIFPNGGIIANRNYVSGTLTLDQFNRAVSVVLDGAWAGSGTLLVTNLVSGATLTLGGNGTGGDMGSFTGMVVVADTNSTGNASAGSLRFNNGGANHNVGNASAVFNLGQGSVQFTEKNGGVTTYFGALIGGPNTQLAKNENYVIGGANLDTTFAGVIQSSSSLTKTGTGTFILAGNNPYTGATTVSDGTLQIGDGMTSGTGTLGAGAVVNNATLVFNRPDDFTVGNAISGEGTTVKQNTNTLTYGGTNLSSGLFLIDQGTVALGPSGWIGSAISLANSGAALDVTQNSLFTLGSTLSGFGAVVGPLTVSAGTMAPGASGSAGTLTCSNGLTELGGGNNQFQLATPGVNDQIAVVGDLTLNGLNNVVVSAVGGGDIPVGIYSLITYTGNLNGALTNLAVSISGGFGTLTNPPGQIALIITPPPRGATNLTWVGDGGANAWDINTSSNWVNGAIRFSFLNGDSVTFDDSGAANPTVAVSAAVLPAAVTVDAAANYTFTGLGDISGATGLIKTNSGTLTILTTNSYTGSTVVAGGTLAVAYLANGTLASGIGAATSDPTNLVFSGTTLDYLGATAGTDRGATLNGAGANLAVTTSGVNLVLNGTLVGPGALTVSGPGTLTLAGANTYADGTILSAGVLALGSNLANNNGLGSTNAPVTFYGGTLQLFGYNGSTGNNYATCYNPLVVPAGQTGTLQMFPRGPSNNGASSGLQSSLTGGGTLNLVADYVRDNLSGDWSAFTGLINVTPRNATGDEMRVNNNFGYASAAVFLNDNVNLDRADTANTTNDLGELGGTSLATVQAGNSTGGNTTWRVGWRNTTATFAGTIGSDNSIIKVGTGNWILTGQNPYTGTTTVSNGVLALATGVNGDGSIDSSTIINVTAGAFLDVSGRSDGTLNAYNQLRGRGTILGTVNVSGTVAPGGGPGGNTGTLTVTNNANIYGTAWMKLNRASSPNSDRLVSTLGAITYGGTLVVTNIGARLQPGDTFTLFSGGGLSGGAFSSLQLPNYYNWNTSQLGVNGSVSVTAVLPPPAISSVDFSTLASGAITLNAVNGATNGPVTVLTTTNLALPLSRWTTVTTTTFDGNGNLSLPITVDPTLSQSYFLLQGN